MGFPPTEHDPSNRTKLIDAWPGEWVWNSNFGWWECPLADNEKPTFLAIVSGHEWVTSIVFEELEAGEGEDVTGFIIRSRPDGWTALEHMMVAAESPYKCAKKLRPYIEHVVDAMKGMEKVAKKLGCGGQ